MKKAGIIAIIALTVTVIATSCLDDAQIEYKRNYSAGAVLYQTHCQNCHGENGEGLSALIPPLTDTMFNKTHFHEFACALQDGADKAIEVNKKAYQDKMPPAKLGPVEMARVLTYTCNSFGNKLGVITIEQVSADLKACQ